MASMNYPISIEQAQAMIDRPEIDTNNSGAIELDEFKKLMKPVVLDHVFKIEDEVEEFRAHFRDADVDCNGYLNLDEFYYVMRALGMGDVSRRDLKELMLEFDIDADMHLDIDEFVMLLTRGDELKFNKESAKMTYFKLKKGRALTSVDFMNTFRKLPKAFMPSFYKTAWTKRRENLPSSVFKVQIDP
jgi:Ca2+-binding EF-hand superfamily protein